LKNKFLKIWFGLFPAIFVIDVVVYWIASLKGRHHEVEFLLGQSIPLWLLFGLVYIVAFITYAIRGKVRTSDSILFILTVILTPIFVFFVLTTIEFSLF